MVVYPTMRNTSSEVAFQSAFDRAKLLELLIRPHVDDVLLFILDHPGTANHPIEEETGLAQPTISLILRWLQAAKVVTTVRHGKMNHSTVPESIAPTIRHHIRLFQNSHSENPTVSSPYQAIIRSDTRRRIILTLLQSPMSVGGICEKIGVMQPAVSHHLHDLRAKGIVMARKETDDCRKRIYEIIEHHKGPLRALFKTLTTSCGSSETIRFGKRRGRPPKISTNMPDAKTVASTNPYDMKRVDGASDRGRGLNPEKQVKRTYIETRTGDIETVIQAILQRAGFRGCNPDVVRHFATLAANFGIGRRDMETWVAKSLEAQKG